MTSGTLASLAPRAEGEETCFFFLDVSEFAFASAGRAQAQRVSPTAGQHLLAEAERALHRLDHAPLPLQQHLEKRRERVFCYKTP